MGPNEGHLQSTCLRKHAYHMVGNHLSKYEPQLSTDSAQVYFAYIFLSSANSQVHVSLCEIIFNLKAFYQNIPHRSIYEISCLSISSSFIFEFHTMLQKSDYNICIF